MFARYVGIDYSGAQTAESSLKGLRVYVAEGGTLPSEVSPPPGSRKYWSRREIAAWLVATLNEPTPSVVGIDHAFSFPLAYFEKYDLPHDWPAFLDDFNHHWPTDDEHMYVDFIRDGTEGNGGARTGSSKWRRLTDTRCRAKSVFHFDVPGSVAKSTHAGLPWLRKIRETCGERVHFWPFDGWTIAPGRSVLAEAYPSLWRTNFPRNERTDDQQDAYAVAAWLQAADRAGALSDYLEPELTDEERRAADIEGWILGVR